MNTIYIMSMVTLMVAMILCISFVIFRKQEEKKLAKINAMYRAVTFSFDEEIGINKKIPLMGVEDDKNTDCCFANAVKKIDLSEDIRIKIYEKRRLHEVL